MKKDNLFFGILLGVIAPVIAFVISQFNLTGINIGNKNLSVYAIAALLNLILMRYYYRNEMENSARGIILTTFICAMLILFFHEGNLVK